MSDPKADIPVKDALQSVIDWWEAAGIDVSDLPVAPAPKTAPKQVSSAAKKQAASPPATASAAPPEPPTDSARLQTAQSLAAKAKTLSELRRVMADFDAGEISDHARQMVFSRGNPEAEIMVIGEAPGRDEDIQGQPFVGKSGQLLDRMFAAINLTEQDFYITNVVNWRPPNNRNPKPEELELCRPFLDRHMELIDPKLIVLVGGVSFSALTGETGIMKNRGQWRTLSVGGRDIPTLPIYHPAFLLRQPALKKDAWRDMLALQARLAE